MTAHRLARAVRLGVALAAVAALSASLPARAQTPLTTLTVGTLSSDNSAAVYYAQELGFFKKARARRPDLGDDQRSP